MRLEQKNYFIYWLLKIIKEQIWLNMWFIFLVIEQRFDDIFKEHHGNHTGSADRVKQEIHGMSARNESANFVLSKRFLVQSQMFYHFIQKNKIIYPFWLGANGSFATSDCALYLLFNFLNMGCNNFSIYHFFNNCLDLSGFGWI